MKMNFNFYALAEPKTNEDFSALLAETLAAVRELSASVDQDESLLAQHAEPTPA